MIVIIEVVALKRYELEEIEAASDLYSGHIVILRTGLHMADTFTLILHYTAIFQRLGLSLTRCVL